MKTIKDHSLLKSGKYYASPQHKDRIVLHHTEGGSARSSVDWWNQGALRVCTPYLVERDGTVLEVFPPEHWAYALGIGSAAEEKRSIHVEICSYGGLTYRDGGLYKWTGEPFEGDFVEYPEGWRGHRYYEKYTAGQVEATVGLVRHLADRFGISLKGLENFWLYDRGSAKGVISHTTVRKDKSDIHPQGDLVGALLDL